MESVPALSSGPRMSRIAIVLLGLGMIVVVVVLVLAIGAGTYNGLVSKNQATDQTWSEIDNQLQRRADLIPNLVATVKGYTKHEEEVLDHVADARSKLLNAKTVEEKGAAAGALNSAIGRLLVVVENYPNLKADTQFIRLQDELAGTENRVAVARTHYNDAVRSYNTSVQSVPTSIVASFTGFKPKPYFEVQGATTREAPKVSF